jgi:hypothetical protein
MNLTRAAINSVHLDVQCAAARQGPRSPGFVVIAIRHG